MQSLRRQILAMAVDEVGQLVAREILLPPQGDTPMTTPNLYPWDGTGVFVADDVDQVANVLHIGIHALCGQLALLTDAIARKDQPTQ